MNNTIDKWLLTTAKDTHHTGTKVNLQYHYHPWKHIQASNFQSRRTVNLKVLTSASISTIQGRRKQKYMWNLFGQHPFVIDTPLRLGLLSWWQWPVQKQYKRAGRNYKTEVFDSSNRQTQVCLYCRLPHLSTKRPIDLLWWFNVPYTPKIMMRQRLQMETKTFDRVDTFSILSILTRCEFAFAFNRIHGCVAVLAIYSFIAGRIALPLSSRTVKTDGKNEWTSQSTVMASQYRAPPKIIVWHGLSLAQEVCQW